MRGEFGWLIYTPVLRSITRFYSLKRYIMGCEILKRNLVHSDELVYNSNECRIAVAKRAFIDYSSQYILKSRVAFILARSPRGRSLVRIIVDG